MLSINHLNNKNCAITIRIMISYDKHYILVYFSMPPCFDVSFIISHMTCVIGPSENYKIFNFDLVEFLLNFLSQRLFEI